MRLAPGKTLGDGRYKLERLLGAGGMASVWLALDDRLGRPVAVKVMSDTLAVDEHWLARFEREALAAASLSHPNIVQVYDYSAHEACPYLVMEYVPGGSLADRLTEHDDTPIDVDALARALLDALAHIHQAGIVHRDVKPGNILLGLDGRAQLTDFGIAQAENATGLTQPGMVIGTLGYLAPEVADGRPATAQSDLYAAGVVLRAVADQPTAPVAALIDALTAVAPERRPGAVGALQLLDGPLPTAGISAAAAASAPVAPPAAAAPPGPPAPLAPTAPLTLTPTAPLPPTAPLAPTAPVASQSPNSVQSAALDESGEHPAATVPASATGPAPATGAAPAGAAAAPMVPTSTPASPVLPTPTPASPIVPTPTRPPAPPAAAVAAPAAPNLDAPPRSAPALVPPPDPTPRRRVPRTALESLDPLPETPPGVLGETNGQTPPARPLPARRRPSQRAVLAGLAAVVVIVVAIVIATAGGSGGPSPSATHATGATLPVPSRTAPLEQQLQALEKVVNTAAGQ